MLKVTTPRRALAHLTVLLSIILGLVAPFTAAPARAQTGCALIDKVALWRGSGERSSVY